MAVGASDVSNVADVSNAESTEGLSIDALLAATVGRYRDLIARGLRDGVTAAAAATPPAPAARDARDTFYGQVEYHLGWRTPDLAPGEYRPGKLMRPALVLLAAEAAADASDGPERDALLERALPAAVAVELVHNFSLVHDDIEDGDEARHGRPTLWKIWGVAQGINTGDGIFAMARLRLWELPARGVAPEGVIRLAALLDRTCLELCEGQHLDMSFEGRRDVTTAMYLEMISRKTAALMACAAEMGARIGAPDDAARAEALAHFGRALGIAFQLRDDLLGIWDAEGLGKSAAGDLRRKKMSLPAIHALEHAAPDDRATFARIYTKPGPATEQQIATLLDILDRAGSRAHARDLLRAQCAEAHAALDATGGKGAARDALAVLLAFVEAEAR